MQNFYGIQMKKAIENPSELTYFLSDSKQVALWVMNSGLVYPNVKKHVTEVTDRWDVTVLETATASPLKSPQFSAYPVTVYGVVGPHSPMPGTTHYQWFTPTVIVPFKSSVPYEFKAQVNAQVTVFVNWWYSHPIFKDWELLP